MFKFKGKRKLAFILTMCMSFSFTTAAFADEGDYEIGPGIGITTNNDTIISGGNEGNNNSTIFGPGMTNPYTPSENGTVEDFLNTAISNPVVKETDKYSYDYMVNDIQTLQNKYGNKMQVNVLGTSRDGRNIYDIVVGNPSAPKQILIQAGIHAREYVSCFIAMKQIEYALNYYDSGLVNGRNLSEMFNEVAIHFLPMTNPDGVTISQFGIDGIRSEELKNVIRASYDYDKAAGRTSADFSTYLTKWKANANGVDLNSNFEARWEQISGRAEQASFAGYKGPSPVSEPESKALKDIGNSRNWSACLSYHAMGQIIYWYTSPIKNSAETQKLANAIAGCTGFKLDGSDGAGGYKDWIQSKDNPIPAVTVEMGSTVCPVSFSEYGTVWNKMKGTWLQAMLFALN